MQMRFCPVFFHTSISRELRLGRKITTTHILSRISEIYHGEMYVGAPNNVRWNFDTDNEDLFQSSTHPTFCRNRV